MPNKTNPLSPLLASPCLKCVREKKDKKTYTCLTCAARTDFALASAGDTEALQRCIAFNYPDLGQEKLPPAPKPVEKRLRRKTGKENQIGRQGRIPATEEHYESYFSTQGMAVNRKYNKNFKTMKEVLVWLYETFKSQKHIAEKELNISAYTVHCMLKCYNIKRLSMQEVADLFVKKNREGC